MSPDIDRLIEHGLTLYGQGKLDDALRVWERVLMLDPSNAQALSYVDYVRHNYELLSRDPVAADGGPFAIADDEDEYQIEISPGELDPPGQGAPEYMDPHDEGWVIQRDGERVARGAAAAAPAGSPGEGVVEIEADEPPGEPETVPLPIAAVTAAAGGAGGAGDPGEGVSFDAATREYPHEFNPEPESVPGFEPDSTPGFGSDDVATPAGFGTQVTDIRRRELGFVQPRGSSGPAHRRASSGVPELKMTLRTPTGATRPPDELDAATPREARPSPGAARALPLVAPPDTPPLGLELDLGSGLPPPGEPLIALDLPPPRAELDSDPEQPTTERAPNAGGAGAALIASLPRPRARTAPTTRELPGPVRKPAAATSELPVLGGADATPPPPAPPAAPPPAIPVTPPGLAAYATPEFIHQPTAKLPTPDLSALASRVAASPANTRDFEVVTQRRPGTLSVVAPRGVPGSGPGGVPGVAVIPPRPTPPDLRGALERTTEPRLEIEELPLASGRHDTAEDPLGLPDPHAPTRDVSRQALATAGAPTRDLGLRDVARLPRPHTEDEPTGEADVRAIRGAAPVTGAPTRADVVLPFDPIDARSAQILAAVDADAPASEAREDCTRRRISSLFERAGEWSRAGELDRAVAAVDLALSEDPSSALAQKLIHRNREAMVAVFQSFLGDLARQPTLARPLHELATAPISPRAAFLLSRVDGQLSLEEILDVSGMPRAEAYRYLCQLFLRGILR